MIKNIRVYKAGSLIAVFECFGIMVKSDKTLEIIDPDGNTITFEACDYDWFCAL